VSRLCTSPDGGHISNYSTHSGGRAGEPAGDGGRSQMAGGESRIKQPSHGSTLEQTTNVRMRREKKLWGKKKEIDRAKLGILTAFFFPHFLSATRLNVLSWGYKRGTA